MASPAHKPTRNWQDIAEEASHERNPQRLMELAKELERALDERDRRPPRPARWVVE